jgi:lysyl-tRNA synthetase class 2
MNREQFTAPWTDLYSEQIRVRMEKRDKLEALSSISYRNDLKPEATCVELINKYNHLDKEAIGQTDDFAIAGRVLLVRDFGKAAFLQVDDGSSRFQVYIKKGVTSEIGMAEYKLLDYGDIFWAKGDLFKTNKGELTLNAKEFHILTKAIRPLPEKFHGMTDPELRYRMRYVDTIMNQESRERLKKRSEIVRYVREFFYQKDFLEVETPMMHSVAGGAAAKPFKTHHNALNMDLSMRIAPELHLKRLIVGGFPRVFEMNRCFRNEGLSLKHNPEFTSIEFYQAFATYHDLMDLTEELISGLAKNVLKTDSVEFDGREISLKAPFQKMTLREAVMRYAELNQSDLNDRDKLIGLLIKAGKDKKDLLKSSLDKLIVMVFEEYAESHLIQPTFITEYPTEVSPLSRRNDQNANIVDRFEMFMNGWEVANAFSELNNPSDQLDRFADQALAKAAGDDEACDVDYDYVRALEYGMPPTAGEGIGIDRLVMLLTNAQTIRDVLLFPLLKKENFFEHASGDLESEESKKD